MTDSSHLVQLLKRELGMKRLPDEEHIHKYQTDWSNESEHQRDGGDALLPGLTHQSASPSVLL